MTDEKSKLELGVRVFKLLSEDGNAKTPSLCTSHNANQIFAASMLSLLKMVSKLRARILSASSHELVESKSHVATP